MKFFKNYLRIFFAEEMLKKDQLIRIQSKEIEYHINQHFNEIFNTYIIELNRIFNIFEPEIKNSVSIKKKLNESVLNISLKMDNFTDLLKSILSEHNYESWQFDLKRNCEVLIKLEQSVLKENTKKVQFSTPIHININEKKRKTKFFKIF